MAIERSADGRVVGGVAPLYLPPGGEDLEIGWQLAPNVWGQGLASESRPAVAHWAFQQEGRGGVLRGPPHEHPRGGHGQANGDGVGGETDKYDGLRLHVYRLRAADVDKATARPSARGSFEPRHEVR